GSFEERMVDCKLNPTGETQSSILDVGELMVREENLMLMPDDEAKVVIRDRHFLGREYRYCLETPSGKRLHARTTLNTLLPVGTRVQLSVANPLQIFPAASPIFPSTPVVL
ncbi:MAG TPA: TOBE domain-containing protein, partial [Stenomitos sp.]